MKSIALQTITSIVIFSRAIMMTIASIMDILNRTLFFGDNLKILEEKIPDNFFDLIYLDPPFNSNRNYNVLFKEGQIDASAQIRAFEDTWEWTPATVKLFEELKVNHNPQIAILVNSLAEFIGQNTMMAYLVNMIARLMPLRRVLKETDSYGHRLCIKCGVCEDKAKYQEKWKDCK